jgi:hypothetical protein
MIKNFLASLALLFSIGMLAQSGTPSPYSFYGIGDITFKGALENREMGGLSVIPDSIHINLQNPASYAGLKLTALTIGITNNRTNLKTNDKEAKATRTPLDYLAVGLPMGKFGAGFGLIPYSSVGYNLRSPDGNGSEIDTRYSGSGGLNKAFLALAYNLNPKWNIGIDFNYNFGQIKTTSIEAIPGVVQYGSRERNTSDMSGLNINLGLMFQSKLKKKLDVFASLVYSPQSNLRLANERNIATILYSDDAGEIVMDPQDIPVEDAVIKMPSKISIGGGIGQVKKWMIGTEITFQQSGDFGNRFSDIENVSYDNAQKYSLGGYFIPKYNSFSSYLARVTYRAGLRYETMGLVINGKSIEDKSFSFGFGFPVGGAFSQINLGLELGRRGTKAAGLIEENYKNFSLSLSLNDRWFVRKKYD